MDNSLQKNNHRVTPLSTINSTWNTGNYGRESTTGFGSNAFYSHSANYNRAYVYVAPLILTGSATTLSGIQIAPIQDQTATIKINSITANATIACTTDNSYAYYKVDALIYNALTNQLLRSQQVVSDGCTLSSDLKYVNLSSTSINFSNVPLVAFNGNNIYIRASADVYYGYIHSGVDEGGAKWGSIQVY